MTGAVVTPNGAGGYNIQMIRGGSPLLLIDGVPQADPAEANMINPNDVESIEILNNSSGLMYGTMSGVIAIYTKRGAGNSSNNLPREGIINHNLMGYYKAREFYSPDYAQAPPKAKPDLRSTIYWNGQLKTGPTGRATVTFYTADAPGRYRLVADGLSASGLPGSAIQYIEVKKD